MTAERRATPLVGVALNMSRMRTQPLGHTNVRTSPWARRKGRIDLGILLLAPVPLIEKGLSFVRALRSFAGKQRLWGQDTGEKGLRRLQRAGQVVMRHSSEVGKWALLVGLAVVVGVLVARL